VTNVESLGKVRIYTCTDCW